MPTPASPAGTWCNHTLEQNRSTLGRSSGEANASPLFLCGHGEDHVASGQVHQVVLIFQSAGHSDGSSLEKVLGTAAVTSLSPLP